MIGALKAEFRKLLTVRSTYFVTLVIIVLTCLFTYAATSPEFIEDLNYKPTAQQKAEHVPGPLIKSKNLHSDKLRSNILESTGAAMPIAVVVLLLMAHEFRYNTITYTLTSSNSRSRVLLAKIIVGLAYTLVATVLVE